MRKVRIRDTLSGELRELDGGREVGIYACGPTVYSRIHIGNARPFVIFSLLARFLRHEGYQARLVINITDVNDKIYDAAREAGVPSAQLAGEMNAAYQADTDALGLGRPDSEPLATETMDQIVSLISALIESGNAYESGGDVYYKVASFERYGQLSNRDTEQMDQGEEAGSAALKESPLDFALWKTAKEGEDLSWDSPWGRGRPGWHIECSAMAEAELGPGFAIHGGGSDLVFPHHENEIAQSEAANGLPFARVWMHNGMVETAALKMSKSEGNIFQLSEALDRYGREAVVAFLISGHYRQPIAFDESQLEQASSRVERVRNFLRDHPVSDEELEDPWMTDRRDGFLEALAADFNTPRALAEVFEIVTEANKRVVPGASRAIIDLLDILGLASLGEAPEQADAEAEGLLAARQEAREARDFQRADELREELAGRGWDVRDSSDGAHLVRRS